MMSLDLSTRCFNCKRFAYHDSFEGEYGASGYICLGCIRAMNAEISNEIKRRFIEEQKFFRKKEMGSHI